ncbi:MAG TPA: hypothetical protein VMN57_03280 [Anaerolineales bacterium]|nr:hypothetical protein [Anaerolineales bacterium]
MNTTPSNRTYPLTRLVAAVVVPLLLLAFIILYLFPDQSGERFAWAVTPHMTALYIGAGYLGGAVQLAAVALGRPWHRVSHGFLPITTFTVFMLVATILHWDRFDLGHFPFQIWLIVYVITPFLIPYLWLRNRKQDPGSPEPGDRIVPLPARAAMIFSGAVFGVFAFVGFFFPDALIRLWVWPLTPLTARVFAGWFALLTVAGLSIGRERRWSAWKIGLASIFVWHLLVAVGAFWNVADFGENGLANWFLILVWVALMGMAGLYLWLERDRFGSSNGRTGLV